MNCLGELIDRSSKGALKLKKYEGGYYIIVGLSQGVRVFVEMVYCSLWHMD